MGTSGEAAVLARIDTIRTGTSSADLVADVDMVIEAIAEDLPLKQQVFADLDRVCAQRTILASTTSTFVPSAIGGATRRPDRVLVTHYFNPPYLLPLVEVVPGPASDETIVAVTELYRRMGKYPALVRKEVPGFIANRLQSALLREAYALVDRGVATPTDIDAVVRMSFGRRLAVAGVFEVGDLAGLDLYHAAFEVLFADIEASREMPRCLRERVRRGELGAKTGTGFYDWDPATVTEVRGRIARALIEIGQSSWADHSTARRP